MKYFNLLILSVGLISCSPTIAEQESCGFSRDTYKQRITWQAVPQVEFFIDVSVPREYDEHIQSVFDEMNQLIGRPILKLNTERKNIKAKLTQDSMNIIYILNDEWSTLFTKDKDKGALAKTVFWSRGDQILEADIMFNMKTYSNRIKLTIENAYDISFKSVLRHELGHAMGLGHIDESIDGDSIMHPEMSMGYDYGYSEKDKLNIKCGYRL